MTQRKAWQRYDKKKETLPYCLPHTGSLRVDAVQNSRSRISISRLLD